MIVISLCYAILNNFELEHIQRELKVVSIDSYDEYARYTVKYKRYKFHFYKGLDDYQLGDILYIKADIIPYKTQTVDFGFNLKSYFLSFQIYGKLDIKEIELIEHTYHVYHIREILKDRIENIDSKNYIASFIFGEKIRDTQTNQIYKNFDILYLFTISGLHVYVLMEILKKVLFVLNVSRKFQHMFIICVYTFMCYLNLFSFAVLRLLIVYIIKIVNKKYDINMQNLDMICLTFFILLVTHIGLIYHQGFIITFLILIFLELFHPLFNPYTNLIKKSMMSIMISIIILPFFQDIYIFQILLLPVIIIMITSLLYPFAILTFMFPIIDDLYSFILNVFETFIMQLSTYQLSFFMPKFNIYQMVLYYSLLIYVCFSNHIKQSIRRILICILVLGLSQYVLNLSYTENITFLDVGQGDTTIIDTHSCKVVIDAFEGTTSYLKNKGIYKLDYLILTHSHSDHILEAKMIMDALDVNQVIVSYYDDRYPSYEQNTLKLKANDYISCGNLNFNFMGPIKDYENENNDSLVFQMQYDSKIFLFTGDIEKEAETDLIETYHKTLKSDILKVPHHGSITSSTKEFIELVNPSYAVISLASYNSFGFPDENVITRYKEFRCVIYRTDINGTISYRKQNRKEKWETFL
jgi:competence protein ComEC